MVSKVWFDTLNKSMKGFKNIPPEVLKLYVASVAGALTVENSGSFLI